MNQADRAFIAPGFAKIDEVRQKINLDELLRELYSEGCISLEQLGYIAFYIAALEQIARTMQELLSDKLP